MYGGLITLLSGDLVGLLFLFCLFGPFCHRSCEASPLVSGIKNKDVREKLDLKMYQWPFVCFHPKCYQLIFTQGGAVPK